MAMEESEFVRIIGGITLNIKKEMKEQIVSIRQDVTNQPSRTWREKKVTLGSGITNIAFNDTNPNYVIVTNYSAGDVWVGDNANLDLVSNYDFKVVTKGRLQFLWGRGLDHLYLSGTGVVKVQSYQSDFDPSAVVSYVY